MPKLCHTQFKVGGLYLYDLPHYQSDKHTKCVVEIVKRFNKYAKVKILKVISDFSGNGYYIYLCENNRRYLYSASYEYLKEVNIE